MFILCSFINNVLSYLLFMQKIRKMDATWLQLRILEYVCCNMS